MRLEGRRAIVTGTSPNIGGGIALGLAAEGAAVVCVDSEWDHAHHCARQIEELGGRATAVACDVTDEDAVAQAVDHGIRTFGGIDVLVNAAAFFNHKGVRTMPVSEWRRQVDVVLTGAFLFTKHVAEHMVTSGAGGAVVNLISTAGHQGEAGNVAYSTAKSGLLNFTRSVAMELAPHGVRVNSVTPTATDPREGSARAVAWGMQPVSSEQLAEIDKIATRIPLGRLPSPSDYAKAIVFLCSSDAAMITGVDLRVDGGAIAQYWKDVGVEK